MTTVSMLNQKDYDKGNLKRLYLGHRKDEFILVFLIFVFW